MDLLKIVKDLLIFGKDIKTRKAVERNTEIIGEAIHRILKEKPLYNPYPASSNASELKTFNH